MSGSGKQNSKKGAHRGSNNSGGRKPAAEWTFVVKTNGYAICKFCEIKITCKIERIRAHLAKCLWANALRNESNQAKLSENCALVDKNLSTLATQVDAVSMPVLAASSSITDFVVNTSASPKHKLDLKTAKYFYASNTAFHQVESAYFLDLMKEARPDYQPPNRQQLEGPLLDELYDNIEKKLKYSLIGVNGALSRPITLVQDGCSSVNNYSLLATSMHTGTYTNLLCVKEHKADNKTADFCFAEAEQAIELVRNQYGKEVSYKLYLNINEP